MVVACGGMWWHVVACGALVMLEAVMLEAVMHFKSFPCIFDVKTQLLKQVEKC